jgi:hypothetical protein
MIEEIVKCLFNLSEQLRRKTAELKGGDHVALICHYADVRAAHAAIDESIKSLYEMKESLSREIVPDAMRAANGGRGIKTINLVGIGRVSLSNRWSVSMLDKVQGMQYLRDTGNEGLIQETVNSSTLTAFGKNLMETEGKELPDHLFKSSIMTITSITKV